MNIILGYTTAESKIPSYRDNKTQKFGTQTLCADENLSTHFNLAFGIDYVRQCVCECDVHSCDEWFISKTSLKKCKYSDVCKHFPGNDLDSRHSAIDMP